MATISADLVKQLRDTTNVSMMECKKALMETDGDITAAIKLLRERGMAVAAKRAAKEAKQGIIAAAAAPDGKTLAIVEVNSETDFVARNADFRAFVEKVSRVALESDTSPAERMHEELMAKIAAIGESIRIRRHARYVLQGVGKLASYIHMGGKVGVLLEVGCQKPDTVGQPGFDDVVKDLTLHIAAARPLHLVPEEVPADVIAAEREIYAKQVVNKPPQIVQKIVDGKLQKFFDEICLTRQGFVKDPKTSITALLAETGKGLGDTLTIRRFVRYQLGE